MAKRISSWNIKVGDTVGGGTPGSDTFDSVENVTSLNGPNAEAAQQDASDNDSTAREYLAGLSDFGSLEISGYRNYGATGQEKLRSLQASGSARNIQIEFLNRETAAVEETFDVIGVVLAFGTSGEAPDGVQGFSATIKTSGAGTFT